MAYERDRIPNERPSPGRSLVSRLSLALVVLAALAVSTAGKDRLTGEFRLGGSRSIETQYYEMTTAFEHFALDGKPIGTTTYVLWLEVRPTPKSDFLEEVTCRRLVVRNGQASVSIPSLAGWHYQLTHSGVDERGQIFGIDQSRFNKLEDETGHVLPPDQTYVIYNTFIDFHSFCNVFGQATHDGKGIQDLHRIGDKIVHAAAFSEPPISLTNSIAEGSTFKNGEVTLELKGVSLVDRKPCALVGYDSGTSSFQMSLEPVKGTVVRVKGGSHYSGDLFVDLDNHWVRQANMRETVITEVSLPSAAKINQVIERRLVLRMLSREEFLVKAAKH